MGKREFVIVVGFLFLIFLFVSVSAFEFNGTVFDINGNRLPNATINITTRTTAGFTIVASNVTTSNESGWFNITVAENALWLYTPSITHLNTSIPTRNYTDYIGQSLPSFPVFIYGILGSPSYFLREAGTFNLTAINSSGGRTAFNFQIKDVSLGYPIAESFDFAGGGIFEARVVVPADRNYSIMIYPNQSLPVGFEWNNFSSRATYNITTPASGFNISHYNGTTRTVNKQFNISMSVPRINGTANFTGTINVSGLDNFTVVAYLMESGNNVHATYGGMPYNMSSFVGGSDFFIANNGSYNMTLPASAEATNYLLFATGRNGSNYLGAFANLTIQYGASPVNIDFVMRGLLGNLSYIGLDDSSNFANKKLVATAKQSFQLINKTNSSLSQAFSHIEITVNYSSWGNVPQFTWIEDVPQSGNGNFSIPLLNVTGIKEMNVFVGGGNYAPKRLELTAEQIKNRSYVQGGTNLNLSHYNITINTFSAGDIEGQMSSSNISMSLYISNSTCDVPSPPSSCLIGGSGQNMSSFNPMGAIMGGGKLSFRMGTGNISVHYVNVDMMASGPPEALFDDSASDRTSGSSFDQAVRFGSGGPTIYDFILVSIPYTETAGTGLNDSSDVNMSVPLLYDDNWNIVWNTTLNGTSTTALSNNLSHYIAKASEWTYLLGQTNCTTVTSEFNSSRPCYIDKTGNLIWIRLPHFSGTGPSIIGTTTSAASVATTASSSSSNSPGGSVQFRWATVQTINEQQLSKGFTKELSNGQRIAFSVGDEKHSIGVKSITNNNALVVVNSTPQEVAMSIGESKKFSLINIEYYDLKVTLNSINRGKVNISIISIKEKIENKIVEENKKDTTDEINELENDEIKNEDDLVLVDNSSNYYVLAIVIIVILISLVVYYLFRDKKNLKNRVHIRKYY